jgi:hypothetical protein
MLLWSSWSPDLTRLLPVRFFFLCPAPSPRDHLTHTHHTHGHRHDSKNNNRLPFVGRSSKMANLIPQNKPLKEHDPVLYDLIQQ